MGKKTLFAAIAAMFFLTGPIVAAEKDDQQKRAIERYLNKNLIRKKIIEIEEKDPLGIITNEDKLKMLKEEIEKLKKKGRAGGTITEKELKKLFAGILAEDEKKRAEDEKKREREEHWQKIKPTAKEWKIWRNGLDEVGRFQCIQGYENMIKYIIDTKEGHVWMLLGRQISYIGSVFPLKEMDELIRELP